MHPKRESYLWAISNFAVNGVIAVFINRLGNVLLKTNCVTDRYPGILSFCYSQQFHLTGWNLIVRMCLTIHQVLFASKQQVQDGVRMSRTQNLMHHQQESYQ